MRQESFRGIRPRLLGECSEDRVDSPVVSFYIDNSHRLGDRTVVAVAVSSDRDRPRRYLVHPYQYRSSTPTESRPEMPIETLAERLGFLTEEEMAELFVSDPEPELGDWIITVIVTDGDI